MFSLLREPFTAINEGNTEEGLGLFIIKTTRPWNTTFTIGSRARAFILTIEYFPVLENEIKNEREWDYIYRETINNHM